MTVGEVTVGVEVHGVCGESVVGGRSESMITGASFIFLSPLAPLGFVVLSSFNRFTDAALIISTVLTLGGVGFCFLTGGSGSASKPAKKIKKFSICGILKYKWDVCAKQKIYVNQQH